MTQKLVCLILFASSICLESQVAPKLKARQIELEFSSPTKTIEIKDTSVVVTEKKNEYQNQISSIPSETKLESKNYTLTRKEVYDLMKYIQDKKFFELNDSYGAPEAERNYPTKIFIKMHGKEKEVVYRSNPSFESAPDGFNKIEAYLLKLRK